MHSAKTGRFLPKGKSESKESKENNISEKSNETVNSERIEEPNKVNNDKNKSDSALSSLSEEKKNDIINKRREYIKSDKQSKKIHIQLQNTHIQGTNEYNRRQEYLRQHNQYGPSYLTITMDEAQEIVNEFAGTGEIKINKDGSGSNIESIKNNNKVVGIVVDNRNGISSETKNFKIHYKKSGTHIVPDYPSKKRNI